MPVPEQSEPLGGAGVQIFAAVGISKSCRDRDGDSEAACQRLSVLHIIS